ncbi:hypothetical protein [Aeromicrobium panaciterrae]|nr:hypothetical protein [Aeromicrobium panaciterrae]
MDTFAEDRSFDEVQSLLHYAHFIPRTRGFTTQHVDTHWPGHTFNGLVELFTSAGLLTLVSPLGALIHESGGVQEGNDLTNFRRILFNDMIEWAVEWPDGSWTKPPL